MTRYEAQKTHEEHITEIWKMFKESKKETNALKLQMQETDRQMKETDQRLNKFIGGNGNRWGALGENLIEGNLVKRLREKGIEVDYVTNQMRNEFAEFDIVAFNGKEIVIVEVKCTLDLSDVDEFVKKISKFKTWFPRFKGNVVYGALAYLIEVKDNADKRAEKAGFFVIKATGDVSIKNKESFKPTPFS